MFLYSFEAYKHFLKTMATSVISQGKFFQSLLASYRIVGKIQSILLRFSGSFLRLRSSVEKTSVTNNFWLSSAMYLGELVRINMNKTIRLKEWRQTNGRLKTETATKDRTVQQNIKNSSLRTNLPRLKPIFNCPGATIVYFSTSCRPQKLEAISILVTLAWDKVRRLITKKTEKKHKRTGQLCITGKPEEAGESFMHKHVCDECVVASHMCSRYQQFTYLVRNTIRVSSIVLNACKISFLWDTFSKGTVIPMCSPRFEIAMTLVASSPENAFFDLIASSILGVIALSIAVTIAFWLLSLTVSTNLPISLSIFSLKHLSEVFTVTIFSLAPKLLPVLLTVNSWLAVPSLTTSVSCLSLTALPIIISRSN